MVSYIGIRADEQREGYVSQKETIKPIFPFIEDGIMRGDVFNILENLSVSLSITTGGRVQVVIFVFFNVKASGLD